jgi:hypothetical protein
VQELAELYKPQPLPPAPPMRELADTQPLPAPEAAPERKSKTNKTQAATVAGAPEVHSANTLDQSQVNGANFANVEATETRQTGERGGQRAGVLVAVLAAAAALAVVLVALLLMLMRRQAWLQEVAARHAVKVDLVRPDTDCTLYMHALHACAASRAASRDVFRPA